MPSSTTPSEDGGVLTRDQVVSVLIEPLLSESVVLRAGPRMFTTSGGIPVRVPRIVEYEIGDGTGASASYWIAENGQIDEADPEYDEVVLLPNTLKSIKVIHRFSNELARHAVVDIASTLQAAIVRRVGLAMDYAFLRGTGDDDTPTGLLYQDDIKTSDYGAGLTVDDLHDAVGVALNANAQPSVWFLNPADFTTLAKQRDESGGANTGQYLLQPDPTSANVRRLLGLPALPTTQMPAGTLLLVDMSQVAVARDVDAQVTLLRERYAEYDQLALRIVSRWDIGLLNPEGVVKLYT